VNVDCASCIRNQVGFEAFLDGVERSRPNAIVLSEAADPDIFHTSAAEALAKIRPAKGRIAIFVWIFRLADNLCRWRKAEVGMEGGAWRALHAMGGPGSAALLEADVVFRMPITRRKDRNAAGFRLGNPSIQNGDNSIAFRYGESSAGTEVILYVHNKEGIATLKTH
jgi:hypothetical protein